MAGVPGLSFAQDCDNGAGNGGTACVNATATDPNGTAIGNGSLAEGTGSVSIGAYSNANNPFLAFYAGWKDNAAATAIGFGAYAYFNSVAIGAHADASGQQGPSYDPGAPFVGHATAIGAYAQATGAYSTAIGVKAKAGFGANAIGSYSSATGDFASAIGSSATAYGNDGIRHAWDRSDRDDS